MKTPITLNPNEFAALGAPDLVYVRPVRAGELLASTVIDPSDGFSSDPDAIVYTVNAADGACLAVISDRDAAFAAAQAYDLAPVSTH